MSCLYPSSAESILKCVSHSVMSYSVQPHRLAHQPPLSMGFSRQEYWSGLPCPPPGDLPHPESSLSLLHLRHWQAGSLPLTPPGKTFRTLTPSNNADLMSERDVCYHRSLYGKVSRKAPWTGTRTVCTAPGSESSVTTRLREQQNPPGKQTLQRAPDQEDPNRTWGRALHGI